MNNKKLLYPILTFIILALSGFLIWNNFNIDVRKKPKKPVELPPEISKKCGIENCHSLNITCGPNVPEMCTMIYELGDRCRQYASCEIIDGECQLRKSDKFERCVSCVENCKQSSSEDPAGLFECESRCAD